MFSLTLGTSSNPTNYNRKEGVGKSDLTASPPVRREWERGIQQDRIPVGPALHSLDEEACGVAAASSKRAGSRAGHG